MRINVVDGRRHDGCDPVAQHLHGPLGLHVGQHTGPRIAVEVDHEEEFAISVDLIKPGVDDALKIVDQCVDGVDHRNRSMR